MFAAILLAAAPLALASASNCPAQFFSGRAPDVHNPKLARDTKPLCFDAFAVLYSGVSLTPLWSAEHITRQRVQQAREMVRTDTFHEEPQLQNMPHPELADYARSGFDRGHMSPNGDMPDKDAQFQSFSLANMIPQSPENNRGLWAGLEASVRDMAVRDGEVYVVTGPLFEGSAIKRLNNRVLVPTYLYKAVYNPSKQQAAAYVTPNAPGDDYQVVSIAELEKRIGINPFPTLPEAARQQAMRLPPPKPASSGPRATHSRATRESSSDNAIWRWLEHEFYRMLKQLVRSL
ncbi:DNA/RNA non-specific endonuclease [Silvimonas sp.]|uniref:DNA/RNA non-specific endonuclease n=1 Tax=Silvimonas sp. TaxID=2650811 RepID=UPI00284FA9FB|nr:DNA/RNA non-specific endonuclease [Silvimonas sp.]MDR3430073.1 DNA/RNA non-specific endonuclease [Silvimonas sp.]